MQILAWPDTADNRLPSFKMTVNLEGAFFVLWARWNVSYGFWTIDILSTDLEPLVTGQKIVIGVDLLTRNTEPRLPRGALLAVDLSGKITRIDREDMGRDVFLCYFTADEIAGAVAA